MRVRPEHFLLSCDGAVATVTLNRPEKKNPLTFASYQELLDFFTGLRQEARTRSVVITGAGGNFCSGGDVHEIIGPLTESGTESKQRFAAMTGNLVKAMRACPQPIVAAIDGVCAGAGAILAMASDFRFGTARSSVAFLFVRVGLSGADMGACAMLPRIVGLGRAAELLYTGRPLGGPEALSWGFYNRVCTPAALLDQARALAAELADGPFKAHATTKRMLHEEWAMGLDAAIEAETKTQAELMETNDFRRAYEAFTNKTAPKFQGD